VTYSTRPDVKSVARSVALQLGQNVCVGISLDAPSLLSGVGEKTYSRHGGNRSCDREGGVVFSGFCSGDVFQDAKSSKKAVIEVLFVRVLIRLWM